MQYLLTIVLKQVAREVNSLLPICTTSRCNLSESSTDLNNAHFYDFVDFQRIFVTKAFSKDNILIANDCQRFSGICYLSKKITAAPLWAKTSIETTCLNRKQIASYVIMT